ncbi:short transient receptor potential channel 1-like, partial [Saccoglossus kowalevskii]|uniref:Short transient receptor potential channel 5-like n=1 Tax=Saccoglossus kowalevskii TaxID=10224 RepID=A0ABM0M0B3_SACKO
MTKAGTHWPEVARRQASWLFQEGKSGHVPPEIIQILSEHPSVQMGDVLLRAVNLQIPSAVKAMCNSLKQRNLVPEGLYARCVNGDFHPDITPIVLAAQFNDYQILTTLVEFGARIDDVDEFEFRTEKFTLEHSIGTIAVYSAISSQVYIALTSEDPLMRAFELCSRLRVLSETHFEYRFHFEEMVTRCEKFTASLLSYLRNTEEQRIVFTHGTHDDFTGDFKEPLKVKAAIKYEQKQ